MATARGPTPEERELEKKQLQLDGLQKQLVERELELETMRGGLISFEKKYQDATTQRYAMLDELRYRIAELQIQQRADAAAASQSSSTPPPAGGRFPSFPGVGPMPRDKKNAKKEKSTKEAAGAGAASGFNPSEELKRLYRDVAKALHPDLANDDAERAHRHLFMSRANEAYESNNEQKLIDILHEWHVAPESVRGQDPAAELIRTIRKVSRCENRLEQIKTDMSKIETAGIFGIKLLAEEADKLERDFLSEMTTRLDEEIEGAKALLTHLGGKIPDASELINRDEAPADEVPFPEGSAEE